MISRAVPAVLAVCGAAAYVTLTLVRFDRFALTSWDNAIFEQAVAGYARLEAPVVDVKGPGFNILGDHFSPIYAILAPFYRIWPDARTLLIAQVVLIALAIYVVAVLAVRLLGPWWGGAIGLMHTVSFGFQEAVKVDFHEVAFGAPLLALAGAAYVERRWNAVVVWSLPLVLVKEDLGLTVAAIGGVLALVGERGRGAVLAVIGVLGTLVTTAVVIPAFAPDGAYAFTSMIGFAPLDEPGRKLATLLLTFAVTGLGALMSPWALVAVPTLAWRFAADKDFYWGTEWHYSLVLMPIVFVALVDAVERFDWARFCVPVAGVVTGFTMAGSPLVELVRDPGNPRAATARAVVDAVPAGAVVETDIGLLTHLTTGRRAYWTGTIGDAVVPEYVAFDVGAGIGSPADPSAYAEDKYGCRWSTVIDRDGYVLLRGESCS